MSLDSDNLPATYFTLNMKKIHGRPTVSALSVVLPQTMNINPKNLI